VNVSDSGHERRGGLHVDAGHAHPPLALRPGFRVFATITRSPCRSNSETIRSLPAVASTAHIIDEQGLRHHLQRSDPGAHPGNLLGSWT
jgi:hypothetical protein